jgi:hypothetical protein
LHTTKSMDNAIGDIFAVEVRLVIDQMGVLKQQWA